MDGVSVVLEIRAGSGSMGGVVLSAAPDHPMELCCSGLREMDVLKT